WGRLSAQVGTPDYMAPEQIRGARGDQRTDIYAFGMILYECLAGRRPYQAGTILAVMNLHVTTSAPPLARFIGGLPPGLEEGVMKAIRRDPALRWQSVEELRVVLDDPGQLDA